MAYKKFLTSVADVYGYDANDNILFTGKTLLDSSIEISLGSAPVRGGRGNQLQYIYYHTAEMNITITDAQWNLAMLSETVGANLETGEFYQEENVSVASKAGTVNNTPLAYEGDIVYGWATSPAGITQRVVFSGSAFTVVTDEADGTWCVRYYTANLSEGKSFTIAANIIPSVVKLVMESQLNSADVTTNKIGIVQIIAPRVALSGAFSLSMTADGVANTPLTGMALAYVPSAQEGCAYASYYAKVVEVIDNTNWYDNIYALTVEGGDFELAVGASKTLSVYAIGADGIAFKAPNSGLEFTSSASGSATVGLNTGVVTGVASGSAIITIETIESTLSGSPVSGEVAVVVI